jgi:hypothetical protein
MRFPGVITVPAFCVHTYFAPGGVSFTVERLWSHPARVCSWQRPLRFDPYTLGARGSEHISIVPCYAISHRHAGAGVPGKSPTEGGTLRPLATLIVVYHVCDTIRSLCW